MGQETHPKDMESELCTMDQKKPEQFTLMVKLSIKIAIAGMHHNVRIHCAQYEIYVYFHRMIPVGPNIVIHTHYGYKMPTIIPWLKSPCLEG